MGKLMDQIEANSFDNSDSPDYDNTELIGIVGMDKEEGEDIDVDTPDAEMDTPAEPDTPAPETKEDSMEDMNSADDSKYDERARELDAESAEAEPDPANEDEPVVDPTVEYVDEVDKIANYDREMLLDYGNDLDGSADEPLINSIADADIGKPTTPEDALTNLVSYPVQSADLESFAYIAGVANLGFKKITDTFTGIKSMFTTTDNTDYNLVAKGFIFTNNDKKFKDYYNYLIGVPMGLNGYLKDISNYVKTDCVELDNLILELDKGFHIISGYMNSDSERESFVADNSYMKHLNNKSSYLLEKNKTFITKNNTDSRSIGSLLRNGDDIKLIISDLKDASRTIKLDKLELVKKKITTLDALIVTMVSNKSRYSNIKIKEISGIIDGLINYTNGVATLVYLKNSTDIIITDIKKIL